MLDFVLLLQIFFMRNYILWVSLFLGMVSYGQSDSLALDNKYLEDQFHIGISYDWVVSRPSGVRQHSFSRSLFGGYQRDIPLNKQRNIGFAAGVSYSYDLLYLNIQAKEIGGQMSYEIISISDKKVEDSYYEQHSIGFPIEFRWRTSTPYSHKFWRIYTGVKPTYAFASRYKFSGTEGSYSLSDPNLKGYMDAKLYIAVGHNTWNVYLQYALRPLFKGENSQNGENLQSSILKIGLIFYIL